MSLAKSVSANVLAKLPTPQQCVVHLENVRQHDACVDQLLNLCATDFYANNDDVAVSLLSVGVSIEIGGLIHWLVSNREPALTVETGFGYGVSTAFFAAANRWREQPGHYCFDPYLVWTNGVGKALLRTLDLASKASVVEEVAHIGLAQLYSKAGPHSVGVALLDGTQLFDELMADFAIIERLLAVDGVLLIRQPHLPQIRALLSFIETNLNLKAVDWNENLAVVQRIPQAERPWFYFQPFIVPLEGHEVLHEDDGLAETTAPDGAPLIFANETSHQYYLRRVLHGREYPALFPDVFQATTILDIGAHVGTAARYFANLYPKARIVCIEPTPESFALLCHNTSHLPRVERNQLAFTDEPGPLRIWRGQQSSGQNSALPNEENSTNYFDATGVQPLTFCNEQGLDSISILKMDIEGMEMHVLRNLQPILERIQIFYIEYHSEEIRHQIDDLLKSHFTLFTSKATEAFRGTVCYAQTKLLLELTAQSSLPRYVFPKADPISTVSSPLAQQA